MLEKLNHNKIYLILILFMAFSCSRKPIYNTEIFCPDKSSILIKFATVVDIRAAVKKAYEERIATGDTFKSTAFRLKDGRSFLIERIAPETMMKCSFRQSLYGQVDRSYVHSF